MFEFLRRLLGGSVRSATSAAIKVPATEPVRRMPEKQQDRAEAANPLRPKDRALSGRAAVDEYFKLSGMIESAKAGGDYKKAVRAARNSFPLMPAVVAQMKKEFGGFDIATSHAIHTGGTLMAVMEDAEGISERRQTLEKTVDLHKWLESADQAESDLRLVKAVLAAVTANPGVDPGGRPVRVYDVGTAPTQITETPSHLYILTPTRLYVLQGDRLLALVDVFDQGRIVVTHNGFGLLQSKSFRWFSPDGRELGDIVTKDPIRRVFLWKPRLMC